MTQPPALTAIPARSDDVLATQSQDVTVLMSMDTGKFVELNETARAIWNLTDGTASIADIVGELAGRYEVTEEQCAADVIGVYARLGEEGLVVFGD